MNEAIFDARRLEQGSYDLSQLPHRSRLQKTALDFMQLVRSNAFDGKQSSHKLLVAFFCRLIDSDDVWYLVEAMVPEFRVALDEQ